MTRPILVLRPEPGAARTIRRAEALGLPTRTLPLFAIQPVAWDVPDPAGYDALMLTSGSAVRQAGAGLAALRALPVHAVGEATARTAREAGFGDIAVGPADAAALLAQADAAGHRRLLHLSGREVRETARAGITVDRRVVYEARALTVPRPALLSVARGAVALFHSPRAAACFAMLVGADRAGIAVAAISPAALAEAGGGWDATIAAATPDDDALLAAAARLCD